MTIKQRAVNKGQKLERRHAILDAAQQLFQEMSFDQISMVQVARQAGVAKGTVYLYFKTKEELFLALQAQEFQAWFDAVDAELNARTEAWSVNDFIRLMGRSLETRPVLIRLIGMSQSILERNIDLATALAFKQMLRERILYTGALLENRLPFLKDAGGGAQLLLRINALVVGIQHFTNPAPIVRQALEQPDLAIFRANFLDEFLETLNLLLTGMTNRP